MSKPFSVVIPVKDDVTNLRRCLAQLKGVEHVLVVGSGDGDRSEAVCRELGVTYIAFHWDGQFPKKRNWVLGNHTFETEWVLFLDADEFVSQAFLEELEQTLPDTPHAGFWLQYTNHFMGKPLRAGDPCPKLALFRVGAGEYERIEEASWSKLDMEVHEQPVLSGSTGHIHTRITHQDYRGLAHWIAKHNEYAEWEAHRYLDLKSGGTLNGRPLSPRQQTKYRHLAKWWFPCAYFMGAYFYKLGFRDGLAGFRVAFLKAQYFYWIRLKIRELEDGS